MRIETGPGWELRLGRWQDVLADVTECDAVITDPPYSERTHAGYMSGSSDRLDPAKRAARGATEPEIRYAAIDRVSAAELATWADSLGPSWVCVFGDDVSQAWHAQSLRDTGRYVFAPVVWLRWNTTPRLSGDGPANCAEWLTVARARGVRGGSRPGFYRADPIRGGRLDRVVVGQKSLPPMRALVRDYSRPGDLIVDPYAGGGTTLLAAAMEGRRAIGAEVDPETFEKAVSRLRQGIQPDMFTGVTR